MADGQYVKQWERARMSEVMMFARCLLVDRLLVHGSLYLEFRSPLHACGLHCAVAQLAVHK